MTATIHPPIRRAKRRVTRPTEVPGLTSSSSVGCNVGETIALIVARTLGREETAGIVPASHLANDLKLDALARIELFMAVELAFHVDFSEEEITTYSTVGALIDLVEHKMRAHA